LCSSESRKPRGREATNPADCPACRRLPEAERSRRIIAKLERDGAAVRMWLCPVTTGTFGSHPLVGKLAVTDRALVFGAYRGLGGLPRAAAGALGEALSEVEREVLTELAERKVLVETPDLQQGFEQAELVRAILAIEVDDVEVTGDGTLLVTGDGIIGRYGLPKLDMEGEQLELLLAEAWDRVPVWYDRGLAYAEAGHYESAIRCFKCGLARDPRDADIWHNLGCALAAIDHLAEARQAFERVLELRHDDADGLQCKAEVEERAGLTYEAIHTYERLISVASDRNSKAAKQARREMERLRRLREM
jgi:tetratricopeptide (TPR) repeat protein